jgi:hypothetical protein
VQVGINVQIKDFRTAGTALDLGSGARINQIGHGIET